MPSITSANAVYTLAVSDLFDTPAQLQGFSAEDIFTTEPIQSAETIMGLDGVMSAGFVYVQVPQSVMLQADSASNDLFDTWWQSMQQTKDVFFAQAVVSLPSINKKWAMTNGILTRYPPIPDAAKTLRFRNYGITWERVSPAPVG